MTLVNTGCFNSFLKFLLFCRPNAKVVEDTWEKGTLAFTFQDIHPLTVALN